MKRKSIKALLVSSVSAVLISSFVFVPGAFASTNAIEVGTIEVETLEGVTKPELIGNEGQVKETELSETITTQGWKKDAAVAMLRGGGKALTEFLDFIGLDRPEAKVIGNHADEIADFLDSISSDIEQKLTSFLINELDIPGGVARTLVYFLV